MQKGTREDPEKTQGIIRSDPKTSDPGVDTHLVPEHKPQNQDHQNWSYDNFWRIFELHRLYQYQKYIQS